MTTRKRRRSSSSSKVPRRRPTLPLREPKNAEEAEEAFEQFFRMIIWKATEEARAENASLREAIANALEVVEAVSPPRHRPALRSIEMERNAMRAVLEKVQALLRAALA